MRQRSETSSTTLTAQQHWLYRAIAGPEAPTDCGVVKAAGTLTPERRVGIYRRAYIQRLLACLRDDFPALEAALGAAVFESCCRDYIAHHPPPSVTLNTYGEHFPGFLGERASLGIGMPPWVSELASLEWATVRAIHAYAGSTLSLDELSRVPLEQWGNLCLRVSDTVQLFAFSHNVNRTLSGVVDAVGSDGAVTPPVAEASWALVCRRGPDVWRVNLAAWAYELLGALRTGCDLETALGAVAASAASDSPPGAERDESVGALEPSFDVAAVMRCFRDWVAWGVFASYTFGTS